LTGIIYKRGDIFYANLVSSVGSEQGGLRPVVIIQNDYGNLYSSTVIVTVMTSRIGAKIRLPVHVVLPPECGLKKESIVMLEQIRTIDKQRLGCYIGHLNDVEMKEIDEALGISVGLKESPDHNPRDLICLCQICASQFYENRSINIRRADRNQQIKDTCSYCNVRQGYDYYVSSKKGVGKNG
jgi:mRNA interferase MazF